MGEKEVKADISKVKKKEMNIINLNVDLKLKLGKKITLTQSRAVRVIKKPEME